MGAARLTGRALLLAAAVVLAGCSGGSSDAGEGSSDTAGPPPPAPARPVAADVRVDVGETYQTIEGFGASYRVWDDPHLLGDSAAPSSQQQGEIVASLVDDLGLTRLRAILDPGLEPENDNEDPFRLDRSRFVYDGKRADEPARVAGQFLAAGVATVFPAPLRPEPWVETPEEFAEWGVAQLLRWRDAGVEPAFYSPLNEPAHERAGPRSPAWFAAAVAALGRGISDAGLSTRLVLPDDLNPTEALPRARAVLEDEASRPFVAALAFHLYGGGRANEALDDLEELARRYDLPLWMTELTRPQWDRWPGVLEWAETVHGMLVDRDVAAVDSMWAYFGDQEPSATLVTIDDGAVGRTPMYFVTRQWSRYVRPGYVRVGADTGEPRVLTSAFVSPDRDEVVVVLVNPDGTDRRLAVAVPGAEIGSGVEIVRSSATEQAVEVPPPAGGEAIDVELPAKSVTTVRIPVRR